MVRHPSVARIGFLLLVAVPAALAAISPPAVGRIGIPLVCEPNQGQAPSEALFIARGSGYNVRFFRGAIEIDAVLPDSSVRRLRMIPFSGNRSAHVEAETRLPGRSHYLLGNDSARWRTNVAHYKSIRYRQVWRGVDLVFYGNHNRLEFDIVLAAGARLEDVRFTFEGARRVSVDEQGQLLLALDRGAELRMLSPRLYQEGDSGTVDLPGGYEPLGGSRVGFWAGDHDPAKPLVVDPVVGFFTYLGGSSANDSARGLAVDSVGNIYVAGDTLSLDFPVTTGPYPQSALNGNIFVTKLDPTGSMILFSTVIGGAYGENVADIALDVQGQIYLTGVTASPDFPTTTTGLRTTPGGNVDGFLLKLNAAGSSPLYGTYLAGSGIDGMNRLALHSDATVYLTGYSDSINFPVTTTAFQAARAPGGQQDAIFVKIDTTATGSASLIYSTFLGADSYEAGYAIVVDSLGHAWVGGYTTSPTGFVTTANALRRTNINSEGFLARFNPAASGAASLVYSTFLGGNEVDFVAALARDSSGSIYVLGGTTSSDLPASATAYRKTRYLFDDLFVAKLNSAGTAITYLTYLGGSFFDYPTAIAVDPAGNAAVVGQTGSLDFPVTANAFQSFRGGGSLDCYATKLNASGSQLVYSSYFGGVPTEYCRALALDGGGNIVFAGDTQGPFPFMGTPGAYQPSANGFGDAFIARILDAGSCTFSISPTSLNFPSGGGAGTVQVTTGQGCMWTASADQSIAGITSSLPVLGGGSLTFDVGASSSPSPRTSTLTIAGQMLTINQAGISCAATLSPSSSTFIARPTASGTTWVSLPGACSWTATSNDLWITLNQGSTSGIGSAVAAFTLATHTGPSIRTGSLTIAGQTLSVIQYPNRPPSAVAASPPNSSAYQQTFDFHTLDPDGPADVHFIRVLFNASTSTSLLNGCYVEFDLGANVIRLASDNGSSWLPASVTPGSSTIVENSFCRINGTGSFFSTYPYFTLRLPITAKALQGMKTVYMQVEDYIGATTGWQPKGVWTPGGAYVASLSPPAFSGTGGSFTYTFSDEDGWQDLSVVNILINNFLDGRFACYLAYSRPLNVLYLVDDPGAALLPGLPLNGSGSIGNSQCTVNGSGTSAAGNGTTLSLTLNLSFNQAGFSGDKVVYLAARDLALNNSGWQPMGTVRVPLAASVFPAIVSVTPASGSGVVQTFTIRYRDAVSSTNLRTTQLLINKDLDGRNACYLGYDHANNLLYLVDDAGGGLLPAVVPNSGAGATENSQCRVNGYLTTKTESGTDLVLAINLQFMSAFAGRRIVYAATQTTTGANSDWHAIGAWVAP